MFSFYKFAQNISGNYSVHIDSLYYISNFVIQRSILNLDYA